ncbi:MAG: hypothetical protein ABSC56_13325 [Solirubrobacteraceae bacterium]
MALRAVGATAAVTGIDWGVYQWASSAGHSTIGMIAGILLVPAGVALAGLLGVTLAGLVRNGVHAVAARRRERTEVGRRGGPPSSPSHGDVGPIRSARGRIPA